MTRTMTTPVIMVPAPAFAGLILACRCPCAGTSTKQVAPTRPLPYFTGVPSIYQPTPKEPPSSSLGAAPDDDEERGSLLGDNNLDMGQEADDEGDGEKDPTGDETLPDPSELELLQEIIDPAAHNQPPPVP